MVQITKYLCDKCGEEVKKPLEAIGWIRLDMTSMKISNGTKEGEYVGNFGNTATDFCSLSCLNKFLKKLYGKALKKK